MTCGFFFFFSLQKSMVQNVFKELIFSTIGDNKSIQVGFIDLLVSYKEVPAAACWARHYGIDDNQLPEAVLEKLQRYVCCSLDSTREVGGKEWTLYFTTFQGVLKKFSLLQLIFQFPDRHHSDSYSMPAAYESCATMSAWS